MKKSKNSSQFEDKSLLWNQSNSEKMALLQPEWAPEMQNTNTSWIVSYYTKFSVSCLLDRL